MNDIPPRTELKLVRTKMLVETKESFKVETGRTAENVNLVNYKVQYLNTSRY